MAGHYSVLDLLYACVYIRSMNKTYTAVLTGDTYPIRDILRKQDWRWNAALKVWTKQIGGQTEARISAGDGAAIQEIKGNKKGCRLTVNGIVRWTSKTFAAHPDQDGLGWNVDERGNPVAGRQIPGSAPDDLI